MNQSRREKIEAMLAEEPGDVFLRYSLAMEMASTGEQDGALELFDALTREEPPHVPAFFRCGQLLAESERVDEARDYLRRGIEAARQQGDLHAAAEMSELLADLGQQ
ncbi:MAG: hypothetical protein D6753_14340 [Planctomycetota bacterium]|nr:MAG: hypothetical protein D6753_14340 [Planctomycetota bacterium]